MKINKDIIIREETPADYRISEEVTRRAFWNKFHPGCDEHLLVHKLRTDPAYVPELSRIAELDGKVVGLIMYSRAILKANSGNIEILSFGPLCVEPEMQNRGIGGALLEHTLSLAREKGYKAVIIFGEPDYYPLHGFSTCDKWGITTPDGKNFDAFMGIELVEGGLNYPDTRFFEAPVYENLTKQETEEFDSTFPYMEKLRLPGQFPD